MYRVPVIDRRRASRRTCSDTCPAPLPPLFGRNAQFFDIANSPARETKRHRKKLRSLILRAVSTSPPRARRSALSDALTRPSSCHRRTAHARAQTVEHDDGYRGGRRCAFCVRVPRQSSPHSAPSFVLRPRRNRSRPSLPAPHRDFWTFHVHRCIKGRPLLAAPSPFPVPRACAERTIRPPRVINCTSVLHYAPCNVFARHDI